MKAELGGGKPAPELGEGSPGAPAQEQPAPGEQKQEGQA
jgi:hypothetical protein